MSSRSTSYQQPSSRPTHFHAQASGASQPRPSTRSHTSHASGASRPSVEYISQTRAKYTHLMHHHITILREEFKIPAQEAERMMFEIPGHKVIKGLYIPNSDAFDHIALCERNFPVNPRTPADHVKAVTLAHSLLFMLIQWLNDEDEHFGAAVDVRSTEILDIMTRRPATALGIPLSAPSLNVPAVNLRPLTPGEFCPFSNPAALFGKTFKIDELVFQVVSCSQLRNGALEFKLMYENTDEPVEVGPQEMQSMLETCEHCPVS